jgi:mono/diheme cytochrome c family protein
MPDALRNSSSYPFHRLAVAVALAAVPLAAVPLARAGGPAKSAVPSPHAVVPGFERFFTGPKADAVKGGQLLLGELNCTSCHRPDAAHEVVLMRRQAPVLDGLGGRVRRSFLKKFLSDPQAVKPGTVMPNVLAAFPEAERARKVEELAHFLASTGTLKQERPEPKLVATGRTLYHQVGCVACHGSRDAVGNADTLLPTSVSLGEVKAKYSTASLSAFLEKPHSTRPSGRMPSLLDNKETRAVANYLLQGVAFKLPAPNLAYAYYEGDWDRLPDFDKLRPRAVGQASGFDLSVARRNNNMAMRFEGYLRVERAGDYRFHLTSDDGSKLFIDGKLAVSNDGIHPPSTVSQALRLTRGVHKLTAGVFNAGGGVELEVQIEGPGLGRQPLAPMLTLAPEGNPKVIAKKDEGDFAIDPALAERGRSTFTAVGCASCHQLNDGGRPLPSQVTARPLDKLTPPGGCLAPTPAKGLPVYRLSPPQRTALAAALKELPWPPRGPAATDEVIARTLTAFNCYACHERGKAGGVEPALSPFFLTKEKEMGEEGRVPPALNGVGAKMNPDYLKKVLATGAHDRPYMLTRMPGFGEPNVGHLVKAFTAVDTLAPVAKVHFTEKLAKVKALGRRMVGAQSLDTATAAHSLGCIKCHTFAGHKAEGVQGIDMTLMPKRLRRDWFHRYVVDPQKFRPGTRMPSSWPNGDTFLTDVLGGDTAKQVEAIWVYLSDGPRALLPLGLKKQFIALVPQKEAILYRNFLEGAGARAIGVGYPEKAHLAFDANDLRLAMIWQGAFIDAARHWTDRGSGFEPPLGDNIVHLPAGVSFAVLGKDSEPWPKKSARELGQRFLGYRLTPDQRPTFLYTVAGVKVEDFPNAVSGKSPSLKRMLTLTAPQPVANLWFRAAAGDKIESTGDGWYRVNGEYRMRIESAAPPVVRQSGGKTELLVPVRFDKGRARLVQEIVW